MPDNATAQVIINIPTRKIDKPFSYVIPAHLSAITIGWRVLVPFGNRRVEGFVVGLEIESTQGLKPILEALDNYPWFDNNMLATAKWLSEYYLCSLAEAMRLFIPGQSGIKIQKSYQTPAELDWEHAAILLSKKPAEYRTILTYIYEHGPVTLNNLTKLSSQINPIIKFFLQHKLIITANSINKRGQAASLTVINLAVSREVAADTEKALPKNNTAQRRLLQALLHTQELTTVELRRLAIAPNTVKKMADQGLVTVRNVPVFRNSYAGLNRQAANLSLTAEQLQVLQELIPAIRNERYSSFLLHGVTGSGKTQVYIQAVAEARRLNKQAIVLVPEIALTSQIIARFQAAFDNDIVVIHSKLSVGERYDAWRRLQTGQAGIVIGARSALFAPVNQLGLIIIDEEHEFTYKQEEAPRYHAREVALARAKFAAATVILGSATPSIETYFQALQGRHKLLSMKKRVDDAPMPSVTVVDMRQELAQGRRSVISLPLQDMLTETLAKKEQAIILLNRRGYSTFVLCRECGHVLTCRHCDISLVYHAPSKILRCHYCQEKQAVPDVCPECGSRYIKYFGTGTQKVEEALKGLFPLAKIIRMDQDTTSRKMAHAKILSAFAAGSYDILLGTQMVAKGHDISNVTAVGIISADTALNLPDFRAAEKTFALLTQAAGRAGRGSKTGRVVMQTYNPEHYAIIAGAEHNYSKFYQNEIGFRQQLCYPPYTSLIKITVQSDNELTVHRQASQLAAELTQKLSIADTAIIGPFPASVNKIKDIFRVNILIKTQNLAAITKEIYSMNIVSRNNVIVDIDPVNVL
ncbi:primosomal protein N' [Sporomusa acidovorans]|uniref:Replication restart protein PriA n=1 Tax=Sporomusa acidovorans (strain ATCC 49682 / DSM 3132 / Mol) TaxID=1123286 RepID=A0ABZ3J310_SPOA4|nr:primosomal protein N' [Sporomusa acidovorans]OZC20226.1 primosomal protein N' [Sporomusa acidovorans DSM 3132]SDD41365.1 replication restart DNA helicase PriA [Sporomusa acidovorans]